MKNLLFIALTLVLNPLNILVLIHPAFLFLSVPVSFAMADASFQVAKHSR